LTTKTTKKVRISALAKELGVTSKDVIEKCKREGIEEVSNPQSTVSIGLSQTIREWFGGVGGSSTAIETAERVDVDAARERAEKVAPKRGKAKKGDELSADAAGPAAEVQTASAAPAAAAPTAPVSAAPVPAPAPKAPEAVRAATPVTAPPSAVSPQPAARAPEPVSASAPTPVAPVPTRTMPAAPALTRAPATGRGPLGPGGSAPAVPGARPTEGSRPPGARFFPGPAASPNVPVRPREVGPVGPRLEQPEKSRLSGPKVVRVDTPDNLPAPRARFGGSAGPGSRPPTGGGGVTGRFGPPGARPGMGGGRPDDRRRAPDTRRRGDAGRTGRAGEGTGGDRFSGQDLIEREERLSRSGGWLKKHRDSDRRSGMPQSRGTVKPQGPAKIPDPVSIKELSAVTGVKSADILKKLFLKGTPLTINSFIDGERAAEIMLEFDIEVVVDTAQSAQDQIEATFAARERTDERVRPPVVTILGHVDHGKTSLLDRIRNTNVASGEAGGITQSTRAFQTPLHAGDRDRVITFIDTPGHEAFTAMRARGAKVTDIAVIVVAADDGVMPQTIESINHAKAAGVAVIVALNKIDKPEATENNIQRIYGQLAEHGLNPVAWGGSTEVVATSAVKGTGIQELLEVIALTADVLELKADFAGHAQGTVLEARMEEGRGAVAQLIVQEGVLTRGDFIAVGRAFGRVRDIMNDRGERIMQAGPSTPVAISGIDELPDAGDKFYVTDDHKAAEQAALDHRALERERELAAPKITLDNIFEHIGKSKKRELPLVVKGDVQGSVETLKAVLSKLAAEEVTVAVKHCAVGGINESDVLLAEATGAIIVGFNVTSNGKARGLAEAKGIDIRLYDVIYDITDDLTKAMRGMLDPQVKLEVLGHAEVRQVFRISKVGAVAGCYVTDGIVERNAQIRVTRDGIVIEKDRRLEQLKRFKDDAREVKANTECGMKIKGYDDIRVGDILECYKTVVVKRAEETANA
jgi:translation initiation factor IF-2